MKFFAVVLARRGFLTPPKEKENTACFDNMRRKLPVMSTAHGFLVDAVSLISPCLHSQNIDMVLAALDIVDTIIIISKHGTKLSTFSVARLVNDLLQYGNQDPFTYTIAKKPFFKMLAVSPNYTLYALERLMDVAGEDLRLTIVSLLYEHVRNIRKVSSVVVSSGCRIALEGLLSPSLLTRLETLDLIQALWYRGTPEEVLVKFFVERRAPEGLLNMARTRLERRYMLPRTALTPELMPSPDDVSQRYGQSKNDSISANNILMGIDCDSEACLISPCSATTR